jgi:hypothetical protein
MKHDFSHEAPLARRPHNVASSGIGGVRLMLFTHLMPKAPGSDSGLSVIINATTRVLRRAGIHSECRLARNAASIHDILEAEGWKGGRPISHAVINTYGFLQASDIAALALHFPDTEFIVLNHSGQSFIHIDPNGVSNIKDALDLQISSHNIRVAGNNQRFVEWTQDAFGRPSLYLPNLYDTIGVSHPRNARRDPDPLRIGTFGALREAKNQSIAQQAAMGMARRLGVGLEWHVNAPRFDSAHHIVRSRRRMFDGLPAMTIIEHEWSAWHDFLKIVEGMDILVMPSFDETFCCVAADAVLFGVPVVCTGAMDWAPRAWICHEPYRPAEVMRVGLALLHDRTGAARDGMEALTNYVAMGVQRWVRYLVAGDA